MILLYIGAALGWLIQPTVWLVFPPLAWLRFIDLTDRKSVV